MPPITGPTSGAIDPEILNRLSTQQAAEAIKRGNIDEILKVTGISRKDWEDFLKSQSVRLNQHCIQTNSNYSIEATYPAPQIETFPQESGAGKFTPQDHAVFMESMGRVMGKAQLSASKAVGKSSLAGKATVADPSLQAQIEGFNKETDNLLLSITDKALETQLQLDYDKENKKIREEFLQLLANANDPETILLALTQYKMREAGAIAVRAGREVQRYNKQQSLAVEAMQGKDVNSTGFYAESQMTQQKVSTLSINIQQSTSLLQTATQNASSALEFGHSVIGEYSKNQDTIMRNFSVKS